MSLTFSGILLDQNEVSEDKSSLLALFIVQAETINERPALISRADAGSFPFPVPCIEDTIPPYNRPVSCSTKEPGSSGIFMHFYTRSSIEWR